MLYTDIGILWFLRTYMLRHSTSCWYNRRCCWLIPTPVVGFPCVQGATRFLPGQLSSCLREPTWTNVEFHGRVAEASGNATAMSWLGSWRIAVLQWLSWFMMVKNARSCFTLVDDRELWWWAVPPFLAILIPSTGSKKNAAIASATWPHCPATMDWAVQLDSTFGSQDFWRSQQLKLLQLCKQKLVPIFQVTSGKIRPNS